MLVAERYAAKRISASVRSRAFIRIDLDIMVSG